MKKLTTNEWIAVATGIMVVGFFFIFGQIIVSAFQTGTLNGSATTATTTDATAASQGTPNTAQVITQDTKIGTGDEAMLGSKVTVNYTGTFTDGKVFDSSVSRNQPFTFTLGAGEVIKGWDQGILGMKVGGKRVLIVPPELGYGSTDYGPIPANSTLIFQVELLNVTK